MRKIFLVSVLSIAIYSCGKKENNQSIDALIESKNTKALQEKKIKEARYSLTFRKHLM